LAKELRGHLDVPASSRWRALFFATLAQLAEQHFSILRYLLDSVAQVARWEAFRFCAQRLGFIS
jgi:hypothetical protein